MYIDVIESCTRIGIEDLKRDGRLPKTAGSLFLSFNETGEEVMLTHTDGNFGGIRWWFVCPRCGRRIAHLYRPSDRSRFLCRHCHKLTYTLKRLGHRPMHDYIRAVMISKRHLKILEGVGQKGFSKLENIQLDRLLKRAERLSIVKEHQS